MGWRKRWGKWEIGWEEKEECGGGNGVGFRNGGNRGKRCGIEWELEEMNVK